MAFIFFIFSKLKENWIEFRLANTGECVCWSRSSCRSQQPLFSFGLVPRQSKEKKKEIEEARFCDRLVELGAKFIKLLTLSGFNVVLKKYL